MKRKHVIVILFLFVGFICFAITRYALIDILQTMNNKATAIGTIAATHSALETELYEQNPVLKEVFHNQKPEWSFLNPKSYDRVIVELAKSHNLDPPRGWEISLPLVDPWGNRFEIGYRKLSDNQYDLVVVSKGTDGIYGTKDDIVSGNNDVSPPKK